MTDKKDLRNKKNSEVNEPEAVYETSPPIVDKWNPNKQFDGTQEEWWEHFREIEKGEFTSLEEANKEFEAWKESYLQSRL